MELKVAASVLLAFTLVIVLLAKYHPKIREKFSTGGLSTINALGWYNRGQHCWNDLYDGAVHCATDSALML